MSRSSASSAAVEQQHAVPILKIGDNLIVSIQTELTDLMVERLQQRILQEIQRLGATGLVIDVTGIEVIDSFAARSIINTARMAKTMDTRTVVVGIRPEVAITLVEMGFAWSGVRTAMTLEHALQLLAPGHG
jgi:rsbT antagonist protein RsbS